MPVRRLSDLTPIVTPADVPGVHAANDTKIAALILAVQTAIDGPTGWLGRSLGGQELEMTANHLSRSMRLPYEPISEIVSVSYRDRAGEEHEIGDEFYRLAGNRCLLASSFMVPATDCAPDAVKVVYKSGYSADRLPASAKHAVIISVQHLKGLTEQSLFLREERVEGVGAFVYTVSEAGNAAIKAATDMLLQPLKLYTL